MATRPAPRPAKAVPMCCVTVGYMTLIMPTANGMKLVDLLQSSFKCQEDFDGTQSIYRLEESAPRVEFKTVQQKQLRTIESPPQQQRRGQLRLESDI